MCESKQMTDFMYGSVVHFGWSQRRSMIEGHPSLKMIPFSELRFRERTVCKDVGSAVY